MWRSIPAGGAAGFDQHVSTPIKTPGDIMDPNVVKVVLDFDGNAIYFSRDRSLVRDTASKIQVRI